MTEKQKRKMLKRMKHRNMTRGQIEKFCTGQTPFYRNREIDILHAEKLIYMVSDPNLKTGVFVPNEEDVFGLSDHGMDYLAEITKDRFRIYLPIIISIASFIVSVIALVN